MSGMRITVLGAGIVGCWQALTLARRGHQVTLIDRCEEPFRGSASWWAGAMLAPYCESEASEMLVRDLGLRSMEIWRGSYDGYEQKGSLVVAHRRDAGELAHFARLTEAHQTIGADAIAELEPDLADRFPSGLFYPAEAHVDPRAALAFVLDRARAEGAEARFGIDLTPDQAQADADWLIDCRGIAAGSDALPELRGVKGEMVTVRSGEIDLSRPVRLLHPRFPLYVVPHGEGRYMVGATVIESGERDAISVRSALDLLSAAYALHPAFGEARIEEFGADVRPAFADNIPRIVLRGRHVLVNGLYRHGFLTAPALAEHVADHIGTGATDSEVFVEDHR